jgi:molecular chaperone GrpE
MLVSAFRSVPSRGIFFFTKSSANKATGEEPNIKGEKQEQAKAEETKRAVEEAKKAIEETEKTKESAQQNPEEKAPTVEELQEQLKKIQERNLFLIAEVENARRRFQRLEQELKITAVTDLAKKLLPVADNFTRLIENGTKQDIKAAIDAVKLIDSDFHNIFKTFHIEKIVSKGQKFDPKYHDAIQLIDTHGATPSGIIIDVTIDGYTIGDKLLRAAKVVVSK